MAQRSTETLIGRLITDRAFRDAFLRDPFMTLAGFIESGHELTALEISAVTSTHAALWTRVAEQVDPRMQKGSLNRHEN